MAAHHSGVSKACRLDRTLGGSRRRRSVGGRIGQAFVLLINGDDELAARHPAGSCMPDGPVGMRSDGSFSDESVESTRDAFVRTLLVSMLVPPAIHVQLVHRLASFMKARTRSMLMPSVCSMDNG